MNRQGGPPQFDIGVSYPIDWFLFGKRAAAIASARLGVDMSAAAFADLVRQRVAGTIAAFYDVLEAQALLDLARADLDNLKRVETITADRVALGGVGTIELDRIRLAVFDSQREVRNRETALATALAQVRAFLGFADAAPAFTVQGSLDVPTPAAPIGARMPSRGFSRRSVHARNVSPFLNRSSGEPGIRLLASDAAPSSIR